MNEHKPSQIEREQRAQSRALEPAPAKDSRSRDYQRIYGAIVAAPMPSLPSDLAQRIMVQVENLAEAARMERWLTTSLLVIMALACLFYAGPSLVKEMSAVSLPKLGGWPLLAAAGLLGAVILDRWPVTQRGQR